MDRAPANEYVECRNEDYYVAGSHISLDGIIYAFRRGESPHTILEQFPAAGSLANIYGAIAFALDRPALIDSYLTRLERRWEESRRGNAPSLVEKG